MQTSLIPGLLFLMAMFGSCRSETATDDAGRPGPPEPEAGAIEWNATPDDIRDLTGSVFEIVTCDEALPHCRDGFAFRGGSGSADPVDLHSFVVAPPDATADTACLRRNDVGVRCVGDLGGGP